MTMKNLRILTKFFVFAVSLISNIILTFLIISFAYPHTDLHFLSFYLLLYLASQSRELFIVQSLRKEMLQN